MSPRRRELETRRVGDFYGKSSLRTRSRSGAAALRPQPLKLCRRGKEQHDRSRNRVGELLYGSYGPSHLTELRGVVVAAPLARQLWQTAPLRRTAPVTEGVGVTKFAPCPVTAPSFCLSL